jgi:hypothetical protein
MIEKIVFCPTHGILSVANKSIERFKEHIARLYEQVLLHWMKSK